MPIFRSILLIAALLCALAPPARAVGVLGATSIDTSAYALGRVRLNVIFLESSNQATPNQENWTAEQLSNVHSEIDEATAFWEGLTSAYHPNARLDFDINYVNGGVPIAIPFEPIRMASIQESQWINNAMNQLGYFDPGHHDKVRAFNDDQRNAADAHWSTTLFVVNDEVDADNRFTNSQFAYGYIGGAHMVLTYANNGWGIDRFNRVLSHELAHTFFALDEYVGGGARNNERSGYLNGINGNSQLNSQGQTITPPQPDALMVNNTLIPSPFTLIQVGHRDTDGDSVPDILDSPPTITGVAALVDPPSGTFAFAGSATVTAIPNLNTNQMGFSSSGDPMTINWISAGEYRIDGGAWTVFAAADGLYDRGIEDLDFSISGIAAGMHAIEVRAMSSVDIPSNVLSFTFESTSPVPEPSAVLLALIGVGLLRRRVAGANQSAAR